MADNAQTSRGSDTAVDLFSALMASCNRDDWQFSRWLSARIRREPLMRKSKPYKSERRYSDGRMHGKYHKTAFLAAMSVVREVFGGQHRLHREALEVTVPWKTERVSGVKYGGLEVCDCPEPECGARIEYGEDGLESDCAHLAWVDDSEAFFILNGGEQR